MKFGIEKRRASALVIRERNVQEWKEQAKLRVPVTGPTGFVFEDQKTWDKYCTTKIKLAEQDVRILRERLAQVQVDPTSRVDWPDRETRKRIKGD